MQVVHCAIRAVEAGSCLPIDFFFMTGAALAACSALDPWASSEATALTPVDSISMVAAFAACSAIDPGASSAATALGPVESIRHVQSWAAEEHVHNKMDRH